MSNKIDACKIDSVHIYEVKIFNPNMNYTVIHPLLTAEVGYRLGDRAMGSNTFEGLGGDLSESSYDKEIQELTIRLIKSIENRVIEVLSGTAADPTKGIVTEEI